MHPLLQLLFISSLIVAVVCLLFSALRHAHAVKTADAYLVQFAKLADDDRVPIEVLERLHKMFQTACHPCAALYVTFSILRYRSDKNYRRQLDSKHPPAIEKLSPAVSREVSRAFVLLFTYATYSLPLIGIFSRRLISSMGRKPEDKRKTKLFFFNAEKAPSRPLIPLRAANH